MEELETKLLLGRWVSPEQFKIAKEDAVKTGKSLWSSLVKLGHLSEKTISIFFAQESSIPYIAISDYKIKKEITSLLDENFCRENLVFPLFVIKGVLFIACSNPLDTILIDSITTTTGLMVEPLITPSSAIIHAQDEYYGPQDKVFAIEQFLVKQNPLQGLSFRRESERLDLVVPVEIKNIDKCVDVQCISTIQGYTRNISASGTALSVEVSLFLPKGVKIILELKLKQTLFEQGEIIRAQGEIIHCKMGERQKYFLGIKFTEITQNNLDKLLKSAGKV